MWFRSVYLKTLRDFRWAILGWGLGMGAFAYTQVLDYAITATPQARASLAGLGPTFAWYAAPISLDTAGGMTNWRLSLILVLLAVWSLLASTRMVRGEEERVSLDVLLARPRGRVKIGLEKLAALCTALLAMAALIALAIYAGGRQINVDFGLGPSVLVGLNAALIAALFGALGLLISQFTEQRGTAAGVTGGLLFVFVVMDMAQRVFPHTEWVGRLSPVYYYNLSKPLIAGYGANPGAMLLLAVLTVLVSALALVLFARRDVGRTVATPSWLATPKWFERRAARHALPERRWSLRTIYLNSLRVVGVAAFWWTVALAGFAAFMALEVKQTEKNLASIYAGSPFWVQLVGRVGGGDPKTNASLLSMFYLLLPVLVMTFAITQASRWASDQEEGRDDLLLARPQPRLRVLLARFAALATATALIAAVTLAATALASAVADLKLDTIRLTAAALSIVPMGLLIAALGYLLAGWLRSALVTSLLSAVLFVSFLISFLGPTLNWSGGLLRLSVLYYYGRPLVDGLPVWDTISVVAAGGVMLAIASMRFMRKDLAT